jgi:hypothetical protein
LAQIPTVWTAPCPTQKHGRFLAPALPMQNWFPYSLDKPVGDPTGPHTPMGVRGLTNMLVYIYKYQQSGPNPARKADFQPGSITAGCNGTVARWRQRLQLGSIYIYTPPDAKARWRQRRSLFRLKFKYYLLQFFMRGSGQIWPRVRLDKCWRKQLKSMSTDRAQCEKQSLGSKCPKPRFMWPAA